MKPSVRKRSLIAHVATSVGWLGAVGAFLALSIAGLIGEDAERVRSAYLAVETIGWLVIVPLSFASLLTGLIMSLGTEWGLFRHYWVVIKLVLNVLASAVLLLHMMPIGKVAKFAGTSPHTGGALHGLGGQPIADAAAAIAVLLVATVLSVIKPRGRTKYGRRKLRES